MVKRLFYDKNNGENHLEVIPLKSYGLKTSYNFFVIWIISHGKLCYSSKKRPFFVVFRSLVLLDHWALSRISTKIKKKIRPVLWSQALVLLARLYGI